MVILIAPYTFEPAGLQPLLRYVETEYEPWLRQQPGFQSLSGGLDRAAGRGVAHYVFDTGEQIDAFLARYEATCAPRFAALGLQGDPASMQTYEYMTPVTPAG